MYTKSQSYNSFRLFVSCVNRLFTSRNDQHRIFKRCLFVPFEPQQCKVRFHHDDQKGGRKGNRYDFVLNMNNSQYLDHMYELWRKDPKSVSTSWDSYFRLTYADNLPEPIASSSPKLSTSSGYSSASNLTTPASTRVELSSNTKPSNSALSGGLFSRV